MFTLSTWGRAVPTPSNNLRKILLRIDLQVLDGVCHHSRLDLSLLGEGMQRGNHNGLGIDFEESPQAPACVTPPKPVGAQRRQPARDPGRDLIRNDPHEIRGGDKYAVLRLQQALHARLSGRLGWMQPVPARGTQRVVPE